MKRGKDEKTMSENVITIKFARGLLGEEFTAKNGNELIRVKIPNEQTQTMTNQDQL